MDINIKTNINKIKIKINITKIKIVLINKIKLWDNNEINLKIKFKIKLTINKLNFLILNKRNQMI